MEIKLDKLALTIEQELRLYSRQVLVVIDREGEKIGKEGVANLREASPQRSGRYAKGWTLKAERMFGKPTQYIIHNKDRYQLTHLLEHGHAKRGGGRVQGQPHIAPVEKEVVDAYLAAVEEAIRQ
ncbi:MAG TPA: hypothetical protein VLH56_10545 [Dissulfurispiraceae bacterium]|nr:hypothetical protein [Dissulfurispiraceae bacterium]